MAIAWEYLKALVLHWRNLVTGLLGLLLGLLLADQFPDLSAWVIFGIVSVVGLLVAQALAWRDMRSERESALRAGRAANVRVERFTPVVSEGSVLLRLKVFNDEKSGTAALSGEVIALEGCPPWGPEPPWHVHWRHGGYQYSKPINGGTNEIVDFANAPIINVEAARQRPIEQWQPHFALIVIGADGTAPIGNPAPLEGVETPDQVCDREMVAVLRIWDDEHHAVATEVRVAMFFQERNGGYWPDLRVDQP